MTYFNVFYHSSGCLPDSEPMEFNCIDDAIDYVLSEYMECIDDSDFGGIVTIATHLRESMSVESPVPTSLYRWTIEEAI